MPSFEDYFIEVDAAFKENPIFVMEKKLEKSGSVIMPLDLLRLTVHLKQLWSKYKKYNVQCGIFILEHDKGDRESSILDNNFDADLSTVIQGGNNSILYMIDKDAYIITKRFSGDTLKYDGFCHAASTVSPVGFYLGIHGIDTLINGEPFETENRFNSYQDVINILNLESITDYKRLLHRFFDTGVQYDPLERYFVQPKHLRKELHTLLIKYPKLLDIKPEARFQKEMIQFLKEHCVDRVLKEVLNEHDERYDVWVATNDDKVYIFEIKWLGKSLTPEGKVSDNYDTSDRVYDGAYQLKDYIDNADKYAQRLGVSEIYCGVLVVFDARVEMGEIDFPEEFSAYPQIDLSMHLKIEKNKVQASNVYKQMKKA